MNEQFNLGDKVYYSKKSYGIHTVTDHLIKHINDEVIEYYQLDIGGDRFWAKTDRIIKL
jgi:RNA polymerase-interacting CarD/CdnL/TRCF family regulator